MQIVNTPLRRLTNLLHRTRLVRPHSGCVGAVAAADATLPTIPYIPGFQLGNAD
jgi:hypothetical protein